MKPGHPVLCAASSRAWPSLGASSGPDTSALGQPSTAVNTNRGHRRVAIGFWSTQHVRKALASTLRAPRLWLSLLPVS